MLWLKLYHKVYHTDPFQDWLWWCDQGGRLWPLWRYLLQTLLPTGTWRYSSTAAHQMDGTRESTGWYFLWKNWCSELTVSMLVLHCSYIEQTFTLWLSGPPHSSSPPTSQCTHMHTQWSFGVTCWEIYSLGRTPYPGLDPSSLIKFLEAGNRLEKPINAACTDEMWAVRRLSTY